MSSKQAGGRISHFQEKIGGSLDGSRAHGSRSKGHLQP